MRTRRIRQIGTVAAADTRVRSGWDRHAGTSSAARRRSWRTSTPAAATSAAASRPTDCRCISPRSGRQATAALRHLRGDAVLGAGRLESADEPAGRRSTAPRGTTSRASRPTACRCCFSSDRPGGSGGLDIWMATRPTPDSPWGKPVNLGPTVNSSAWDMGAKMSADGLSMLLPFRSPGGLGGEDIWMTTRATKDEPWGPPQNLGPTRQQHLQRRRSRCSRPTA